MLLNHLQERLEVSPTLSCTVALSLPNPPWLRWLFPPSSLSCVYPSFDFNTTHIPWHNNTFLYVESGSTLGCVCSDDASEAVNGRCSAIFQTSSCCCLYRGATCPPTAATTQSSETNQTEIRACFPAPDLEHLHLSCLIIFICYFAACLVACLCASRKPVCCEMCVRPPVSSLSSCMCMFRFGSLLRRRLLLLVWSHRQRRWCPPLPTLWTKPPRSNSANTATL